MASRLAMSRREVICARKRASLRYKAQRKSFATADMPEEKAGAIAASRMDKHHDRLNALLDE